MSRGVGVATARLRLALVLMVGGVAALLMPSLFAAADTPSAVVLAAVAVVVAAVVRLDSHVVTSVARALVPQPRSADEVAVLTGRVTDPLRHPLRPRAPGLA